MEETGKNYVVRQGDCLSSIAARAGLLWKTVWEHQNNGELRTRRKDPNILSPGDVVYIPPVGLKEYSGATEQTHKFVKLGTPAKLRLRFLEDGEPRANEEYILRVDGDSQRGTLDSDGRIETFISPKASKVEIIFEGEAPISLKLGTVDPITEVSGIQGRLNNLGYGAGAVDNKFGPKTLAAVQRFRRKYQLEIKDEIDGATREKLLEAHGS